MYNKTNADYMQELSYSVCEMKDIFEKLKSIEIDSFENRINLMLLKNRFIKVCENLAVTINFIGADIEDIPEASIKLSDAFIYFDLIADEKTGKLNTPRIFKDSTDVPWFD